MGAVYQKPSRFCHPLPHHLAFTKSVMQTGSTPHRMKWYNRAHYLPGRWTAYHSPGARKRMLVRATRTHFFAGR
jgi:hypothetical protein